MRHEIERAAEPDARADEACNIKLRNQLVRADVPARVDLSLSRPNYLPTHRPWLQNQDYGYGTTHSVVSFS